MPHVIFYTGVRDFDNWMVCPVMDLKKFGYTLFLSMTLCGPGLATPSNPNSDLRAMFRPTSVPKDAPLWQKYLAAGDAMKVRHNEERAKKYWLAALSELETSGSGGGGSDISEYALFPRLESRLLTMYPDDWSKTKLDSSREKLQKEQVDVLKRVTDLMKGYQVTAGPNRGLLNMAEIGYKQAVSDLEKTKAALEAKEK